MRGAVIGSLFQSHYRFDGCKGKDFNTVINENPVIKDAAAVLCFDKTFADIHSGTVSAEDDFLNLLRKNFNDFAEGTYSDIFKTWVEADKSQPLKIYDDHFILAAASIGALCKNSHEIPKEVKKTLGMLSSDSDALKTAELFAAAVFAAYHGAVKSEISDLCFGPSFIFKFENKNAADNEDEVYSDENDDYPGEAKLKELIPAGSARSPDTVFIEAVYAFLQAESFEDTLYHASRFDKGDGIICAFAGCLAEAYYGIPNVFEKKYTLFLPESLRSLYRAWKLYIKDFNKKTPFGILTKYVSRLESDQNLFCFQNEFLFFAKTHSEYELEDYEHILQSREISWTEDSLTKTDSNDFDAKTLLACIMAVFRADYFSPGVLHIFISKGVFKRWLQRLKTIDKEAKAETDFPDITDVHLEVLCGNRIEVFKIEEGMVSLSIDDVDEFSIRHTFNFSSGKYAVIIAGICMKIREALESSLWKDTNEVTESAVRFRLQAIAEDKSVYEHFGVYNRVHLPEKEWLSVIETIRIFFNDFINSYAINTGIFMNAMNTGEVKYCGVEFSSGGHLYHYRTDNLDIAVGDRVIVPVGADNDERIAYIKTVEFCRWDNTPYPLEKTKAIIAKVSKNDSISGPYYIEDK